MLDLRDPSRVALAVFGELYRDISHCNVTYDML